MADYIEKTNAIPGVGRTKVTRVWNGGISPADMIPSEAVKAWYENVIGTLNGEAASWLTAVYSAASEKKLTVGGTVLLTIINSEYDTASDVLVNTVQEEIDPQENAGDGYGLAPIGHLVTVKSAEGIEINVTSNLIFEPGYGWNNLQGELNRAVSEYLLELRKAWADSTYLIVRTSQIDTRLLGVQGVLDVQDTLVNGSHDNFVLGN